MPNHPTIPTTIKSLYPDMHPDDALYGLYREKECNVAKLARYIHKKHGISISRSGLWRQIERIEKDRLINGNGDSNGH